MSSISKDIKLLIEYVNKKDDTVKQELFEQLNAVRDVLTEEVRDYIYKNIKEDPELRGPTGYTGPDGDQGPQGVQGPRGITPKVELDESKKMVRFQVDSAITESTGDEVPLWSDWVNLEGPQGPQGERGLIGESGADGKSFTKASIHEDILYLYDDTGAQFALGNVKGATGDQGPAGPMGQSLTWHDLSEAQRELLVGPSGTQGPKGDPGQFPMVECNHEERKIRFQVREDYTNPWGEWIDMPVGPQGEQGPKGDRWMYEDFKPEHLMEITGPKGDKGDKGDKGKDANDPHIAAMLAMNEDFIKEATGPMGPQGPVGPKGDKGDKGDSGADADLTPIKDEVADFKKKVVGDHTKLNKKVDNSVEKLRQEMTQRVSDVRFTRLNELLIPTAAMGVAGDVAGADVVQEVKQVTNSSEIRNGTPIYIDNQIKASLRGEVYDEDNYLVYAAADHISQVADALAVRGSNGTVYLYRLGVITVEAEVIADGASLIKGEYYYLAAPRTGISHGQITINKPTFGVAQIVGQALSENKLFVNTTIDPVILNRTEMAIQGRNGALLSVPISSKGVEGDAFGDTIFDDQYFYYCTADYDGLADIWKRIAIDNSTW